MASGAILTRARFCEGYDSQGEYPHIPRLLYLVSSIWALVRGRVVVGDLIHPFPRVVQPHSETGSDRGPSQTRDALTQMWYGPLVTVRWRNVRTAPPNWFWGVGMLRASTSFSARASDELRRTFPLMAREMGSLGLRPPPSSLGSRCVTPPLTSARSEASGVLATS